MQSLFQVCWVLGLPFSLPRVLLRLWLSEAGLAVFLEVPQPLLFGLPLVVLGMLSLGFLGKSWWNP